MYYGIVKTTSIGNQENQYYNLWYKEYSKYINSEIKKISSMTDKEKMLDQTTGTYNNFEKKWNIIKKEGKLREIIQTAYFYRFFTIITLGIIAILTLYLATIYSVSSIVGVSLMYIGTIVLGLSYYGEGRKLATVSTHFFWLELLILFIAAYIVMRAFYRKLKNKKN